MKISVSKSRTRVWALILQLLTRGLGSRPCESDSGCSEASYSWNPWKERARRLSRSETGESQSDEHLGSADFEIADVRKHSPTSDLKAISPPSYHQIYTGTT